MLTDERGLPAFVRLPRLHHTERQSSSARLIDVDDRTDKNRALDGGRADRG